MLVTLSSGSSIPSVRIVTSKRIKAKVMHIGIFPILKILTGKSSLSLWVSTGIDRLFRPLSKEMMILLVIGIVSRAWLLSSGNALTTTLCMTFATILLPEYQGPSPAAKKFRTPGHGIVVIGHSRFLWRANGRLIEQSPCLSHLTSFERMSIHKPYLLYWDPKGYCCFLEPMG